MARLLPSLSSVVLLFPEMPPPKRLGARAGGLTASWSETQVLAWAELLPTPVEQPPDHLLERAASQDVSQVGPRTFTAPGDVPGGTETLGSREPLSPPFQRTRGLAHI